LFEFRLPKNFIYFCTADDLTCIAVAIISLLLLSWGVGGDDMMVLVSACHTAGGCCV
jgi:hypothetical protein